MGIYTAWLSFPVLSKACLSASEEALMGNEEVQQEGQEEGEMKTKKEHYLSQAAETKPSKSGVVLLSPPNPHPRRKAHQSSSKPSASPKAASSPSLRAMGPYMQDVKMGVLRCGIWKRGV